MTKHIINGQRIYAREEGPKTGQVALLIHGWSSSWYAFSPLIPLLSKRFRCIAVDLPGYGNSPPLPTRVSIEAYADILFDLLCEVTDNPAVVIGHSMGGMIALTMALRHRVQIERLVLLCPTVSGHLSTSINLFVSPITMLERYPLANWMVSAMEPYMLSVTDRLMRPVSFAERTAISEDDYIRLRSDARRPGQGRVRAECYWAMREGDLRGKLAEIEPPSLVLWGAEDNTVPLRDAGVVADEWPSADLRIIPKAGHWPQFETPEITRRYLTGFLGLPSESGRLKTGDAAPEEIEELAQMMQHSEIGSSLSQAQRIRLASQGVMREYPPGAVVARANEPGEELFIVKEGSLDVLLVPEGSSQRLEEPHQIGSIPPGQITGELALLGGARTAALHAGSEGAILLVLHRDDLRALFEDDPALGNKVLLNIASALALRLRLTNWQKQMAVQALQRSQQELEVSA